MVGVLQRKSVNDILKVLLCGLLLAATLLALPAHAENFSSTADLSAVAADAPQMSVVTEALPHDFSAKSLKVGLVVIEIERLDAIDSDIVYIRLAENQAPDDAFQALNVAFPNAAFELLETGGDDGFDLIDF